jgi:hypothetical protein
MSNRAKGVDAPPEHGTSKRPLSQQRNTHDTPSRDQLTAFDSTVRPRRCVGPSAYHCDRLASLCPMSRSRRLDDLSANTSVTSMDIESTDGALTTHRIGTHRQTITHAHEWETSAASLVGWSLGRVMLGCAASVRACVVCLRAYTLCRLHRSTTTVSHDMHGVDAWVCTVWSAFASGPTTHDRIASPRIRPPHLTVDRSTRAQTEPTEPDN